MGGIDQRTTDISTTRGPARSPRPLLYTNHLRTLAMGHRSKVALIEGDATFRYDELWSSVLAVADGLARGGVGPGDVVATAMATTVPHLAVLLGILHRGAVACPLNTRLTPPELATYVERIHPVTVVADAPNEGRANELGLPSILLGDAMEQLPLASRLAPLWGSTDDRPCTADELEPAIIIPTGGTSGTPKGAVLDHRAMLLRSITFALESERDLYDVQLNMTPFFHASLYAGALATLGAGATVHLLPRFDPGEAIAAIERGANNLAAVATMLQAIRRHDRFGAIDRSGVRRVGWGAMPASAELIAALHDDYPNASLQHTYGSTETGAITRLHNLDIAAGRYHGVGRARPGVLIRVLDDEDRDVAPGQVGEFAVHTPYEATHYWGQPEESAKAFTAEGIRLGDLGSLDEDGWVTIAGRKKEMILSGGEHVFPKEVEEVLGRHPDVLEIVVYGVPDDSWGERVEAAVVTRPGTELSGATLVDFGRASLGGYKLPKVVRRIGVVPLTPNEKPDRRAVAAQAASLPELA